MELPLGTLGLLAITLAWVYQLTYASSKLHLGRQFVVLYGTGTAIIFIDHVRFGLTIDTWLYLLTLLVLTILLFRNMAR